MFTNNLERKKKITLDFIFVFIFSLLSLFIKRNILKYKAY